MTRTGTTIIMLLLTLAASTTTAAGHAAEAELCKPGEMRKCGHPTYYWTLEDRFKGNESYRVFCGPLGDGSCEGGWKPVSVTMYLYWEETNTCAMTVQAEIHESDSNDPAGPRAGRLVATSEVTTVGPFRPAGLWAVTVPLSGNAPVLDGPCFATISFLDTCAELPSMVAAPGACVENRSWKDTGGGWVDMHALDLPGNLSAYATFECQRPGEDQPVAWSTIKSMYGESE